MFKFENPRERAGESGGKIAARGLSVYLTWPAKSLAILTAAGLAIGFAGQGLAGPPGGPAANEVFSGCEFDPVLLDNALTIDNGDMSQFMDGEVIASYIVIYRRDTQNNGQALGSDEFTGPVVCVATPLDENSTAENVSASASAESVPVPNEVDQPDATSVDILATQGGSILQYRVNGGDRNENIENRVCLSTDTGVDCVLVQPQ